MAARAQVVLLQGEEILLVRHVCVDREYWVLPGGAVEPGETVEEAAVREVEEETGLQVQLECLLFVDGPRCDGEIVVKNPRHTFLGRIVGGILQSVEDRAGEREGKGYLAGAGWHRLDHSSFDVRTRDTLRLVRHALGVVGPAPDRHRM